MKILLFNSLNPHKKFNENLPFVDEEFGIFPPLDLCYIAAVCKKNGHEVKLIDQKVTRFSENKIKKLMGDFRPDILGLNIHSLYTFFEVLESARMFKKISGLPIVVGGYALRTHYTEILSYKEFDFGIIGSGLKAWPEFLKAFDRQLPFVRIAGLVYREGKKLLVNPPKVLADQAKDLPLPDRSILQNNKYRSIISKNRNFTIMLTTLGCPSKCTYCAINYFPYSQREIPQIITEIKDCVEKHKIREIDFFDAYFTADKKYVEKLCTEIIRNKIKVNWSCRTSLSGISEELLSLMRRSGCRKIYYGIESANQKTLARVKKDLYLNTVKNKLLATRKAGIQTLGFFMIGLPGDTEKEIKETIAFAKSLPLDWAQFSIMIAKPNTKTEKDLKKDHNFWSEYILGKVPERRIESPWCNLPYEQVKELTALAYRSFYFRPAKILNFLWRIRSLDELWRYLKAGWRTLWS